MSSIPIKIPSLCLGTAAFGMDYGITNPSGKVPSKIVSYMTSYARSQNINQFDTALAYGDACTEIGKSCLIYPDIKVMSKLPSQSEAVFMLVPYMSGKNIPNMLSTLNLSCLDTLLLHDPDARKDGSNFLFRWLDSLKERGLVKRTGLSIYSGECLKSLDLNQIDVVQLPISLYDQRLLSNGVIDYLLSHNINLHGRSFYLQGLMLESAIKWPSWIPEKIKLHHLRLHDYLTSIQSSYLEIALEFARSLSFLEYAIFGVCNQRQLDDLIGYWSSPRKFSNMQLSEWSIDDKSFLDPRMWPK